MTLRSSRDSSFTGTDRIVMDRPQANPTVINHPLHHTVAYFQIRPDSVTTATLPHPNLSCFSEHPQMVFPTGTTRHQAPESYRNAGRVIHEQSPELAPTLAEQRSRQPACLLFVRISHG